jgi:hypothetical protein
LRLGEAALSLWEISGRVPCLGRCDLIAPPGTQEDLAHNRKTLALAMLEVPQKRLDALRSKPRCEDRPHLVRIGAGS